MKISIVPEVKKKMHAFEQEKMSICHDPSYNLCSTD